MFWRNLRQLPIVSKLVSPKKTTDPLPTIPNNQLTNKNKKNKLTILLSSFLVVNLILIGAMSVYLNQGNIKRLFPGKKTETGGRVETSGDWKKLNLPSRPQPFFTLSETTQSTFGLFPQKVYVLTAKEAVDESFIKQSITSSLPVNITKKNDKEFIIAPKKQLDFDEVLSVVVNAEGKSAGTVTFDRNFEWAVQASPKLNVVSTLPGNKTTSVPVNSGIEFTFNQEGFADPSKLISIEPYLETRIEVRGATVSIIPLKPMRPNTVYTVTLKKGLTAPGENNRIETDTVITFQTQSALQTQGTAYLEFNESFVQISPDDVLLAKVYAANWNVESKEIQATVYAFPSHSDFITSRVKAIQSAPEWARQYGYYRSEYTQPVDTSGLSTVASANVTLQRQQDTSYLSLPDKLPPGFYLVQFRYDKDKDPVQLWVQSTRLSGYVAIGKEQSMVWVNQIGGGAVPQAVVTIAGDGGAYSTNDEGYVVFETPQTFFNDSEDYVTATAPDESKVVLPVIPLNYQAKPGTRSPVDYWAYLYHERVLYKPTDTVNFWGVVKSRDTDAAPSEITIQLKTSYPEQKIITTKTVQPNADGSYLGAIDLAQVPTGWYYLETSVNSVIVSTSSLTISEYEKPDIKIEVSSSKKAIFANEKVDITARASFFDGTPVTNLPLIIGGSEGEKVETDSTGAYTYSLATKYVEGDSYPQYHSLSFAPVRSGDEDITGYGGVTVYGSRVEIESRQKTDGANATLEGTVYTLDLTNFNKGTSNEVRSGVAKGQKVTIDITREWYEQQDDGTYYDFIEKVTRQKYKYVQKSDKIQTLEVKTDENGTFSHQFGLEQNKTYRVTMTAPDQENRKAISQQYYYFSTGQYIQYKRSRIEMKTNSNDNEYSIGERVEVSLTKDQKPLEDTDQNRFLFITANRGRQQISMNTSPSFSFNFSDADVPNVTIGAVIFNGKHYDTAKAPCRWEWGCYSWYTYYGNFEGLTISYSKQDRNLEVKISQDKETYNPGDTAQVTVKVTKGGSPVSDASVQIVLVDQALEAMGAVNKPDPLGQLYRLIESLMYYSYYSHKPVFPDESGAERGGGGGDRDLFKDTAYFDTGKTNNDGSVVFTVKLPDNITSWLTFAQAVTSNLDAGHGKSVIVSSKEFFVLNQFPRTILSKDRAYATLNSYGTSLGQGNQVAFETIVENKDGIIDSQKQTGQAFKESFMKLPALRTGKYFVTGRGTFGERKDGVKLPLDVLSSRFSFTQSYEETIEQGQSVADFEKYQFEKDTPITVVVADKGKGIYFNILRNMCYLTSNRIERNLSKLIASEVLEAKFDETTCEVKASELSGFQAASGGIRQVVWGESNIETSLWATYIKPDYFDKAKLITYFNGYANIKSNQLEQRILALWGLSLLDSPKINALKVLLPQAKTVREKVLLALALVSVGEKESARELYSDILSEHGYSNDPYIRIQDEKSEMNNYMEYTSLTLLLGTLLRESEIEKLHYYLRDFRSSEESIAAEVATVAFINQDLLRLPEQLTEIMVKSPSQSINRLLERGNQLRFTVPAADIPKLEVTAKTGKADVITQAVITPEQFLKLPTDDRLKLTRSINKIRGEGKELYPGDIVKVELSFDINEKAPPGCYTVTDYVPSGLSPLKSVYAFGIVFPDNAYSMEEKDSHVMQGCVYNSSWNRNYYKHMVYYARVAAVGDYIVEPATMQSVLFPSIFQKTDEQNISIAERK